MKFLSKLIGAACLCIGMNAHAELNLELTGGIDSGRKITVVPFGGQNMVSVNMAKVINDDLSRTGVFAPTANNNLRANPHAYGDIRTSDFDLGTEVVVVGDIKTGTKGFQVSYTAVTLNGSKVVPVLNMRAEVPAAQMRTYAHMISNAVFEKLTSIKGAFLTKIAYIRTVFGSKYPYELCISDYDGANENRLVVSTQPLMSPSWSPDGRKLAYVSFENRKAEIFVIDIATKARTKLTSFPGLNGNPKWSPDGRKLAVVLSKDGNPEIYIIDIASRKLSRVTNNPAIDTEPAWSASGNELYFVSERGGKAQIYQYSLRSGGVQKVTHQPVKNLSPATMPDGSGLVMINQSSGFTISRQDSSGGFYALSNTRLDESPTVAPNSNMIMYSTVSGGRKGLVIVSSDGRSRWSMDRGRGEMSQPAWSPYRNK